MARTDSGGPLDVLCPCCEGRLVVDRETGAVIDATPRQRGPRDVDQALGQLRGAGERRDEDFLRAFRSEQKREQILEERFRQAQRRAGVDGAAADDPESD